LENPYTPFLYCIFPLSSWIIWILTWASKEHFAALYRRTKIQRAIEQGFKISYSLKERGSKFYLEQTTVKNDLLNWRWEKNKETKHCILKRNGDPHLGNACGLVCPKGWGDKLVQTAKMDDSINNTLMSPQFRFNLNSSHD